jgi:predicted O-linked N-acetylglucosamine transferase (SPINDLY family)
VVLIDTHCRAWLDALGQRFAAVLPDVAARIRFLPRLAGGDYLDLLAAADVVLDTPHFNGMNSSLEAFAVGTPIVTLPGTLQRGRHTAAMYRAMALEAFVAADAAGYVATALRLGTDADARRAARALIAERSPALYDDGRVVAEFARFFEAAADRVPRR